jgi:N-acetylglucosaminyl-diphospho-decaprenol L-rhamnosyltransferase
MVELSIIIVNYKTRNYLDSCLESISACAPSVSHEVIVIDNASYDGSKEMMEAKYPGTIYIQSDANLGFAKANNLASKKASGRIFLFLNPDTVVLGTALDTLYAELVATVASGSAGPVLLNSDMTLQTSCIQSFPTIANQVADSEYLRRAFPNSGLWGFSHAIKPEKLTSEVDVISGACLMVRKEVFEAVEGFSEEYFMYYEDTDLCYKIRRKGWKNIFVPQAKVIHHGGGSTKVSSSTFSDVMMAESMWRFFNKTRGRLYGAACRGAFGAGALARLLMLSLVWLMRGKTDQRRVVSKSLEKWSALLRWSCGMERWVLRYYSNERLS